MDIKIWLGSDLINFSTEFLDKLGEMELPILKARSFHSAYNFKEKRIFKIVSFCIEERNWLFWALLVAHGLLISGVNLKR